MKIDRDKAAALFRAEAALAFAGEACDVRWTERVEELSRLCDVAGARTHIAFLGASMLAKAVNSRADLFAIKPTRAKDNPNAYSARTLCHGVLVPLAAELGVNIGVSRPEPLNNLPYMGMSRLGDKTPISGGAREAFDFMVTLVRDLNDMASEAPAIAALRAFISVRKRYAVQYQVGSSAFTVTPETLAHCIEQLLSSNSEKGKLAQAAAAGLFDVFAGPGRVQSGGIHDPSRHYPGDVCVLDLKGRWEKAVEVRHKKVSDGGVHIFGDNCRAKGVLEAAIIMAAPEQPRLDDVALSQWATSIGIGLTLFYGWQAVVDQVLFWGPTPKPDAVAIAVKRIEERLIAVEASANSVALWQKLVTA